LEIVYVAFYKSTQINDILQVKMSGLVIFINQTRHWF